MSKGVAIMKKMSMTILAVFLAIAVSSQALAFNGGYGRGRGGDYCYRGDVGNTAGLNLSEEQTAKIRELREAQWKDIRPIQEKMFSKRGELRQLWLQKNPDENKITAVHKEIRALRDQMQDKMLSYRLAMFKILTPEQQTKVQARIGRGFGCEGSGPVGPRGPGWSGRGNW
jgi:Spy/CpxP family protein refolding chaperone